MHVFYVHIFLTCMYVYTSSYINLVLVIRMHLAMKLCVYFTVQCSKLTDPLNGMILCSPGDDEVSSYEDICSFTCNTGYKLTGSDTRTCQNDGNWNGTNSTCERGNNMWFIF